MGGEACGEPSLRGSAQLSDKEKRLSDALRRNLQRRKRQDRARKAEARHPEPPESPEKGEPAEEAAEEGDA